jgi:hypothetical protein
MGWGNSPLADPTTNRQGGKKDGKKEGKDVNVEVEKEGKRNDGRDEEDTRKKTVPPSLKFAGRACPQKRQVWRLKLLPCAPHTQTQLSFILGGRTTLGFEEG